MHLPLTASLVPSSAASSPFLLRHALDLTNVIMFVSRASTDGNAVPAGCFRMLAPGALAAGGVDVDAAAAAFRFLGFAVE